MPCVLSNSLYIIFDDFSYFLYSGALETRGFGLCCFSKSLQKTRKCISCRGGWEVRVEEVHKDAGCESAILGDKLDLGEIGKSSFFYNLGKEQERRESERLRVCGNLARE